MSHKLILSQKINTLRNHDKISDERDFEDEFLLILFGISEICK